MCIAILKPKGTRELTVKEFDNCFDRNRDGFGCMFQIKERGRNKLKYFKTQNRAKALQFFKDVQVGEGVGDIAFHFRIATHGNIDEANCHPFSAGNGFLMMHNGMLHLKDPFGKKSDTAILADLLSMKEKDWYTDAGNIKALESFATGSKLVFMSATESFILNEIGCSAHWHDDIWFSNYSYEKIVYIEPKVSPNTYTYNGKTYDKWGSKKKKNKPYTGGYIQPMLSQPTPTKEQEEKIKEIQEWTQYKSSIQGLLTRQQREDLNTMGMEETNFWWNQFSDGEPLTIEEKKNHIQEFYNFILEKSLSIEST